MSSDSVAIDAAVIDTDDIDIDMDDIGDSIDINLDIGPVDPIGEQAAVITKSIVNPVVFPPSLIVPRGEIVFDIETIPDLERRHLFGLDEMSEKPKVDPIIGNWPDFMKKPIKDIEAIIDSCNPSETWVKAFATWERSSEKPRTGILKLAGSLLDKESEKIKTMSVTPEMLRIVAIGIGWRDASIGIGAAPVDVINGFVTDDEKSEADLLEWFWDTVKNVQSIVGYNVLAFDVNAIKTRSKMLGVKPSRNYVNTKPWDNDVIDLMVRRWPKGGQMKLKPLLETIGVKVPYPDCDGSKVFEMWQSGKRAEIAEYVKSDVYGEMQLAEFWRGLFW